MSAISNTHSVNQIRKIAAEPMKTDADGGGDVMLMSGPYGIKQSIHAN